MDQLLLKGMTFYAYHGVSTQERQVGNTFIVDLKVEGDFSLACQTDLLIHAVNYAELYKTVSASMQVPCNLLEHLAETICTAIKRDFPQLLQVEITVTKNNPPLIGQLESASVVLCR